MKNKSKYRPLYIPLEAHQKLMRAYYKMAGKVTKGKVPLKAEFFTEVIEKGLEKCKPEI